MINFVVVTYNSSSKVADCLDRMVAAANSASDDHLWTFVDNSEDSSDARYLRNSLTARSRAQVLAFPDNPGFARACNEGARAAADSDWTIFLNPDLILTEVALADICNAVRDNTHSVEALAFGMRTAGQMHQGVTFNSFGWFKDRRTGSDEICYGPSGGAGAYKTSLYLKFEGFREELFAWGEDADLAHRLHTSGITCGTPDFTIDHLGGHSIAGSNSLAVKKIHWLLRNRFDIAGRLYSKAEKIRFVAFATVVVASKIPVYAKCGGTWVALKTYVNGLSSIMRGRNDKF